MWAQRCCAAPRWPRRASGAAPSAAGAGTSSGPSRAAGLGADLPSVRADERDDLYLVELLQFEQVPPSRHRDRGIVLRPWREDHFGGIAAGHLPEFARQVGVVGILVGDPDPGVLQVVDDQFIGQRLRVHAPRGLAWVMFARRGRVTGIAGAFRAHRDVRVPDLPHPLTGRCLDLPAHHRRGLLPQPTAPGQECKDPHRDHRAHPAPDERALPAAPRPPPPPPPPPARGGRARRAAPPPPPPLYFPPLLAGRPSLLRLRPVLFGHPCLL